MPHPFFVKDRDSRYVYCNELFANMLGLRSESILGKHDPDIHPPSLAELFCRQDQEVLQSGVAKTYLRECVEQNWDCVTRTVKVPYRDEHGQIVGVLGYLEDVSEEQKTKRQLEIKSLAVETGAAVAITDPSATVTYVNQAFLALWREDSDEAVLGKKVFEFHADPADVEAVVEAIQNQNHWAGEILSLRRDGSTFPTIVSAGAVRDATGNIVNMLATFLDMSEAKERERALRESENRFDQVARNNKTFVWEVDRDGLITYVSGYFEMMLGYRPEDVVGSVHFYDAHPVAGRERFREEALAIMRKGERFQELIHPEETSSGDVIWVATNGEPLYDEEGVLLGYRGSDRDITEFHALQEDLRVKKQAMDNSITGIVIAPADGRISYANAAFRRMWGAHDMEELIGKHAETLFADPSLAGHRIEELLRTGFHSGEIEALRLDGSMFPVSYAANIVYNEAGQPAYMIGTYQDVSERKKQQQLEQDRDVAQRANEAKTRFLSSVSHELRTPLNAIMGFAQVLEMDPALHADHADLVKEILVSGGSLVSLINQILEFARIETGEGRLSLEKLSCELAVFESVERALPLARERNIEIATCLDQAPTLTVLADHARLVDILGNFLSNAVKYNRESGNVEITVAPVADRVRFTVTDNGYGIPAEKQGELFQSFDRLGKEAGTEAGSGVGLAMSKRLVEQMGGIIGFTSSPDAGSTFWVELPQG